MALGLYAGDNDMMMPITCTWGNIRGYIWRYNRPDIYEDPLSGWPEGEHTNGWASIGLLLRDSYLPRSRTLECPDFVFPDDWSWYKWTTDGRTGEFRLPEILQASLDDPSIRGDMNGSYIMNTDPYYADTPTNISRGRLGRPGRNGAFFDPDVNWYGPVEHITSLIQCFDPGITTYYALHTAGGPSHKFQGVNCTYIDGHVRFLDTDLDYHQECIARRRDVGNNGIGAGEGMWPYATYLDQH
jgi:prepilin-type processing-associated H-X9-DG protein